MVKALLLSAAYGWFAGLLTVMVIVTALFALILYIALKPIKKDELDDSSSAKKALGRRETELTIELLNKQNDAKSRAELEGKLREVKSAERLVNELMQEEESAAVTSSKPAKASKPAKPAAQSKPEQAKPAEEKPVKPAKPAEEKQTAPTVKPAPQAKPAEEKKVEAQPAEKEQKPSAPAASDKPEEKK